MGHSTSRLRLRSVGRAGRQMRVLRIQVRLRLVHGVAVWIGLLPVYLRVLLLKLHLLGRILVLRVGRIWRALLWGRLQADAGLRASVRRAAGQRGSVVITTVLRIEGADSRRKGPPGLR